MSSDDATNVTFATNAPPHAFPSTYPPNTKADPFPRVNGCFTFAPPPWYRTPATRPPLSASAQHDVDALAAEFTQKLSFASCSQTCDGGRERSPLPAPVELRGCWYHATITVPLSAPLQSLVRKGGGNSQKSRKPTPLPYRQPCRPRPHAFLSWANSVQLLTRKSNTFIPPCPRSVSSASTSSVDSISSVASDDSWCQATPPSSPVASADREDASQHVDSPLTGDTPGSDASLSQSSFNIDTYASLFPDFLKQYTSTLDHLLSSPLSMHFPL